MAYDPQKTKSLLPIVGAFAGLPGGDFTGQLADQLREAEAEIKTAMSAAAQAERDLNKATADLEAAQQTIVRLRSGTNGYSELLAALQSISRNPRGSKKVADDALATVGANGKA